MVGFKAGHRYSHVAGFVSYHEGGGESVLVIERAAPQRVTHPRHRSITWASERKREGERESTALLIRNKAGKQTALTTAAQSRSYWGQRPHRLSPFVQNMEHQRDRGSCHSQATLNTG